MHPCSGKTIVLGVTGGIAAYRAVELLRLLTKAGATVHVVMTASATQFVTPLTFQTLAGTPVMTDLFELPLEHQIGHISLADRADLIVVAPATANLIGKVAHGLADDLLSTTIMASKAPVLFIPAMNSNMYENPIYQKNEQTLRDAGYQVMKPDHGLLACGWEGAGKFPAPASIMEYVAKGLTTQDLTGHRILITAGPTREELDPVRFISNHSSGTMGYALAREAFRRGASVDLVTGPVCLEPPTGVATHPVTSTADMHQQVFSLLDQCDVVIKAAAVADYRPEKRNGTKIKKDTASPTISLAKNPDILKEISTNPARPKVLVGFAAETDQLESYARKKMAEKGLDLLVANDVSQEGAGFGSSTNIATLFDRDGHVEALPCIPKEDLARIILDRVASILLQKR